MEKHDWFTGERSQMLAGFQPIIPGAVFVNSKRAGRPDPDRFDVTRTPNDHVGFGGPGPHFCLGAQLARREITVMFRELFRRMPDLRSVGDPARLQSNFINGIKHLPCEFTPGR